MANAGSAINDAALVMPDEMHDAHRHLAQMIEALTVVETAGTIHPEIICVSQGWLELQIGRSVAGIPLYLAGRQYLSGLGTHADSEILIRLPVGAQRLTGLCGVNDSWETRRFTKPLVFSIEVDSQSVWRSDPQDAADAPAHFDITLAGCTQFTLKVTGPPHFAHADWVDLRVTLDNGDDIEISKPPAVNPGFSFQYGGAPSAELLPTWRVEQQQLPEQDGIILHRITRTDPRTGLAVICEIQEYTHFPVLAWSLRLKNTLKYTTPEIKHIQSLDVVQWIGRFPYLNYWMGDLNMLPEGHEPFRVPLAHATAYQFAPVNDHPADNAWPCFMLECPATNRGLLVAIGSNESRVACFRRGDNHAIDITAGPDRTADSLLPGDEIRTPVSVLLCFRGDRLRAENLWQQWIGDQRSPEYGRQMPSWVDALTTPIMRARMHDSTSIALQATPGPLLILGEPVVVSRPPADMVLINESSGPWQFPATMQRLPDGRLQLFYNLHADATADFGLPPGVAVSADHGHTWANMTIDDPEFASAWGVLALPNGDRLRQVRLRPRTIDDVMETLPPPFTTWENWAATNTVYLAEKLPASLAGYRFARLTQGSREWVEETAVVQIPGEVRECIHDHLGAHFAFPWMHRMQLAPDGSLWGINHHIRVIDGALSTMCRVAFLRSTDHGRTWNLLGEIPYQPDTAADRRWDQREGFTEPNITFLPDGSVFCLMRTEGPLYASRSTDNGQTWSTPVVFDNIGVWPALVTLQNGVTLASYGRPGLYLRATDDPAGRAWGSSVTVVNPGALGCDTCAYSDLIALDDHTALLSYADYHYPDADGRPRKTILVRTITVVDR